MFDLLDQRRDLRDHVVHVLKHRAFGGAQLAGVADVLDHLLVLTLDLIKKLAQQLQLLLRLPDHADDPGLHGHSSLRRLCDLFKAALGLVDDAYALAQGLLGGGNASAELVGPQLHLADSAVHLAGQVLDLPGQLLDLGRHHRKAAALCPGSGRLDGGVDGQNIGLLRNGYDLPQRLLDSPDRVFQLGKGLRHSVIGLLHLHGGLAQRLHLVPGLRHRLADRSPHLTELLCRRADAGEGLAQLLKLHLKLVALLQNARKGHPDLAQLPEGGDLLFHKLLLILLQALCDMQHRIQARFLLNRRGWLMFAFQQHQSPLLYSKTTQVID